MKKNIFLYVGIILMVVSVIIGCITDVANDLPAVIGSSAGMTLLIVSTWKKSEKKNGWTLTSIILAAVSGVLCVLAGLSEDKMNAIIIALIAAVSLIVSVILPVVSNAIKKD